MVKKFATSLGLAIIIAAVLSFKLSSFWFWTCWEVLAAGAVAIGCFGEWYMFLHPAKKGHEFPHRRRELQFITAVAIGVAMEFFALFHAIPEGARLERGVAEANERTSTNELHVAELTHSNLMLQSSLDETKTELANAEMLVIKVKNAIPPRQIPEKQRELFISTLLQATNSGSPKIDIKVFAQDGDDAEANDFADTVRRMLNDAGYGTNRERVIKIPPFTASPVTDSKKDRMPLIFAIYATDYSGKKIPLSMPTAGGNLMVFLPTKNSVQVELTNSQIPVMSYYSTNPNDILGGVCNLMRYIGFPPTELVKSGLLNPGEVAFYIPPQVQ